MKKKTILASLVVGLVTSLSNLMATDKDEHPTYDYIIVGNGTAGAVLARKLSDGNKKSVLVLEQGINHDGNPMTLDVNSPDLLTNLTAITADPQFAETYAVTAFFPLNFITYSEGKGWGGSSAHNYLQVVRGTPGIYNGWATASGNNFWTYNNLLPLMLALENYTPCMTTANPAQRGTGGPISVTQANPVTSDPLGILLAAPGGTDCGFITDINDPTQVSTTGFANLGVSAYQLFATADSPCNPGHRSYSANEFLPHSVVSPSGEGQGSRKLRIESHAQVSKVIFDGKKAIGVKFVFGNQPNKVLRAYGKKIILCAGGVNTPAILQRSGIGDPALLKSVGVKVRVNNPNVGANLINQYGPRAIVAATTNAFPFLQAFVNASGIAAPNNYPADTTRRLQFDAASGGPGVSQVLGFLLSPNSRGTVQIVDKNALTQPLINLNMFSDGSFATNGTDANLAVTAYKLLAKSVGIGNMISPAPPQFASDFLLFQAAESATVAESHIIATCRMGTSKANGVVDGNLRVFGTKNLYVVDASAIPVMPDGNICYAVYALALGASVLLGVPVPPAL